MNPDLHESFERNVGNDILSELEHAGPACSNDEEFNEIDLNFGEEDYPVLNNFHKKKTRAPSFNAITVKGEKRKCKTPENSQGMCNNLLCQPEKSKTSCSIFKESISTGNSVRRNNETFSQHCNFLELGETVAERGKKGMSDRFQMTDTDDCIDNDDSEKDDDDKIDEDDDDLTKKLLSIQVLPRIPKLKRTETSVGGASSDLSIPQRSVLERAEVTTKLSSYPKWPKSNGCQTDDKRRWRNEHKNKDSRRGSRNQKEVESRMSTSRNFIHKGLSHSNFRRPVDFEKPKANFSKRVPCEQLFDAVVAKENVQLSSSCKKDGHDFNSRVSDSDSCDLHAQTSADDDSTDCKDKKSCKSKDHQVFELQNKDDQLWNSSKGEDFKRKEVKVHKRDSTVSLNRNKISELKSRENNHAPNQSNSRLSEKQLLPNAPQSLISSGTGNTSQQNGRISDVKLPRITNEHTNSCDADSERVHESVPLSTTSKDVQFKQPSTSRVPRSVVPEHAFEQINVNGSKNNHLSNFDEMPMNWNENNGSEQFESKSLTSQNDSPSSKSTLSPNQMDSVMEVVDMDIAASPLCDDKLSLSAESTATAESFTNAATRKVVTFDCPENPENSDRNGSKKQMASKRETGDQQTSLETKHDIQKQVVAEMKELLRPLYSKRKITKEEYKEIMRQTVPKLCHNRTTLVASTRIKKYADKYASRVLKSRKQSSKDSKKKS